MLSIFTIRPVDTKLNTQSHNKTCLQYLHTRKYVAVCQHTRLSQIFMEIQTPQGELILFLSFS
nr:unnamed protein product [Callosobruchus chinensis]